MPDERIVVFTHIPKTAGTTLHFILERQYQNSGVFTAPDIADSRYSRLPAKTKVKIRLIKGHFIFGIHEHCPLPVSYMAMFRRPHERIISDYNFRQGYYKHNFFLRDRAKANYSLKEYLKNGASLWMDNCHVRYLCGVAGIPYGGVNEEHLKLALDNLNKYAVIGITEFFDESVLLFAREFGWQTPFYQKKNVTSLKVYAEELDVETESLIAYYTRYDNVVYQRALELFKAQVEQAGPEFQECLSRFVEGNRHMFWGKDEDFYTALRSLSRNPHNIVNLFFWGISLLKGRLASLGKIIFR